MLDKTELSQKEVSPGDIHLFNKLRNVKVHFVPVTFPGTHGFLPSWIPSESNAYGTEPGPGSVVDPVGKGRKNGTVLPACASQSLMRKGENTPK